jgi:hypothetical protein
MAAFLEKFVAAAMREQSEVCAHGSYEVACMRQAAF